MNVVPEVYEKSNSLQHRNAIRLFKEIQASVSSRRRGLIADIGCGPGSTTQLIPHYFPCDEVLGFDVDPKMIGRARDLNSDRSKFRYEIADVQADSSKMLNLIDANESGADMIVSIYCFHWVRDKHSALKNVESLLAKNGSAHLLFYSFCLIGRFVDKFISSSRWSHLFPDVSPVDHTNPPDEDERLGYWERLSEKVGLLVVNAKVIKDFYAFEREEFLDHAELQFGLKLVPQRLGNDYGQFNRECRAFLNQLIDEKIDLTGLRVDSLGRVVVEVQSISLHLEKTSVNRSGA